jgi:hypothetical protein
MTIGLILGSLIGIKSSGNRSDPWHLYSLILSFLSLLSFLALIPASLSVFLALFIEAASFFLAFWSAFFLSASSFALISARNYNTNIEAPPLYVLFLDLAFLL